MAKKPTAFGVTNRRVEKEIGVAHFFWLANGVFENAIAGIGNPGQAAILVDLRQISLGVMAKLFGGKDLKRPHKGIFRTIFLLSIGPEKYKAISIVAEEMAEQLVEVWDDSTLHDSRTLVRKFLSTTPEDYMTRSPKTENTLWAYRRKMTLGKL
jgi:hypothetical protein